MSSSKPPTENLPVFNLSVFTSQDETSLKSLPDNSIVVWDDTVASIPDGFIQVSDIAGNTVQIQKG